MSDNPYSNNEIVQRGEDIYSRDIRAKVEPAHAGEFLVIDIETGDWEMDPGEIAAMERLAQKKPEAPTYLKRIGYPTVHRIGALT